LPKTLTDAKPNTMTITLRLFLAFIFILVIPYVALSQDIDHLIFKTGNALLKNKEIRAVSIGVYKDGEKYTGHFGSIAQGESTPPNDETIYEIASVTETFTGYLAAKAVKEGRIKLNDDIRTYLEGDFNNLEFEGKVITIKHLLTHTAGMPHFMDQRLTEAYDKLATDAPFKVAEFDADFSKEEFFKALARLELKAVPGTEYSYSNAGAELVGYILTVVNQKSIDELFQEAILEDANMTNTAIRLNEEQKTRLIKGYWLNNSIPSPNQFNPLWASGHGLKSTLADLMNYIEFNLKEDNPILDESHELLYEKGTRWMGYFWNIWKDKHGTSFNHHGGASGMQNWLYLFPKYNLGISLIVNHSGDKTPRKLSKAANSILKELADKN